MINLLAKDAQKRLRSARRNIMWVRYNLLLLVVIITLNIGLGAVFFLNYFDQASATSELSATKNQNIKEGEAVKKQADAFRDDLKAAKTLLDANISYTDIITTLSNATPDNCSVQTLSIDADIYKSKTKDMDFSCAINGRKIYDIVSTLITDLERSLVYTKVYVKQTITDTTDSNILQISVSLTTQDPGTKIASAIPTGCQLQSINATQHDSVEPYIALKCRPSTASASTESEADLQTRVQKTLKESCYFDGLKRKSVRFQTFAENYYIAQYVYTFNDISLKAKAEKNSSGEVVCQ